TRVAIVDDHPVYRQGLVQAIMATPEFELVAAYRSIEDLNVRMPTPPQVIVLDLRLPGLDGAAGVRHLSERGFTVLVVSASEGEADVLDAIAAGAHGYLTKEAEP